MPKDESGPIIRDIKRWTMTRAWTTFRSRSVPSAMTATAARRQETCVTQVNDQHSHSEPPAPGAEAFVLNKLLGSGLITAGIHARLTERLATPGTLSALHVIAADAGNDMGAIIAFLSHDSNIPVAPLASFQAQKLAFDLAGPDFAARGALAFETMESDVLVAILNPYNRNLQDDIRRTTECRCMFFLVDPADYDQALDSLGVDLTTPDAAAGGAPPPAEDD